MIDRLRERIAIRLSWQRFVSTGVTRVWGAGIFPCGRRLRRSETARKQILFHVGDVGHPGLWSGIKLRRHAAGIIHSLMRLHRFRRLTPAGYICGYIRGYICGYVR